MILLYVSEKHVKDAGVDFFMTGYAHNPIFEFGRDAFFEWWRKYDDIVDYVLIDYLILLGYKNFKQIKELIDDVPDNNLDIF